MRNTFCICENKTQISCAVTSQLISAFVFTAKIVQSFYSQKPNCQASSHLVWFCSPVCVGPGRKPRRQIFSHRGSIKEVIAVISFKLLLPDLNINSILVSKIDFINSIFDGG